MDRRRTEGRGEGRDNANTGHGLSNFQFLEVQKFFEVSKSFKSREKKYRKYRDGQTDRQLCPQTGLSIGQIRCDAACAVDALWVQSAPPPPLHAAVTGGARLESQCLRIRLSTPFSLPLQHADEQLLVAFGPAGAASLRALHHRRAAGVSGLRAVARPRQPQAHRARPCAGRAQASHPSAKDALPGRSCGSLPPGAAGEL
eukprot:scaffold470_cov257-Pinguiococcus_pyrenoidosus.AAC.9